MRTLICSLCFLIAVFAAGCSGRNPVQPVPNLNSNVPTMIPLGSWQLEINGLGRQSQTFSSPGPNISLVEIQEDEPEPSPDYAELQVATKSYDREAHLLILEFTVINRSET